MKNKRKAAAIIQARMGSTRFPGKVLADIAGKPMLWHVVNRLRYSKMIDRIIVATSIDEKDDAIEIFCRENNIDFYRGSEEDVLGRYYRAAKNYRADPVVRITADCPLIDPQIVDMVVKRHINTKSDYTNNILYPRGLSPEVFNYIALENAYHKAKDHSEREHVTVYFYRHPELFKLKSVKARGKFRRPDIRICVDEKKDLDLVRRVFKEIKDRKIFFVGEIIDLFNRKPELLKINSMVKQKGV